MSAIEYSIETNADACFILSSVLYCARALYIHGCRQIYLNARFGRANIFVCRNHMKYTVENVNFPSGPLHLKECTTYEDEGLHIDSCSYKWRSEAFTPFVINRYAKQFCPSVFLAIISILELATLATVAVSGFCRKQISQLPIQDTQLAIGQPTSR